jgi:hypothetical protein
MRGGFRQQPQLIFRYIKFRAAALQAHQKHRKYEDVRLAQICQLGKVDADLRREVGVIFGTALFAAHFLGPVRQIELQSLNESNHIEQLPR